MNLKHRLSVKSTATVRFLSEKECIFSDEVSNNHENCLSIMKAKNKAELWDMVVTRAQREAAQTKFNPIVNVVTPDGKLIVKKLTPIAPIVDNECPLA